VTTPRRWTEELGGIRWLPRMIDKARLANCGELGSYLFGHSPVDAGLLRRLGITTAEFAAIVAASTDDDGVLVALRARGFDAARVDRWSRRLHERHPWIIHVIDLDERHIRPNPFERVAIAVLRPTQFQLMALVRRVAKAP
jgi:Domain of unknown function (DUF5069)